MKTTPNRAAKLSVNLVGVTPTFQSACLAGWKTGVTKRNRFMNRSTFRQVLDCGDGVFGVAALDRGGSVGDELQSLERSQSQSGDFADSVTAVQDANAPNAP